MRFKAQSTILTLLLAGTLAASAASQTVYSFPLEEGQENPPSGSAASGLCLASLNAAETELQVICSHDVVNVTAAHIHNAPAGMNGGVVFPFPSPASPFHGAWALSPSDVANLQAGNLYVNVHSMTFPGGEIRGQIGAASTGAFNASLDESQEVPPTGSVATGGCAAVLNNAQTELTTACRHDVSSVTGAHIHNAPPGVNGGIVFPFSSPASPFIETWALGAADLAELKAGNLYVNVHSGTFPGGEIRGQLEALPLFTDGFESGDVSVWSLAVP